MTGFPPGLVWLASYPKSGNTWMRVLLANLKTGQDRPADINRLSDDQILLSRWRFTDDMLVEPDLLKPSQLQKMRRLQADFVAKTITHAYFCKTHDLYDPDVLGEQARCTLYLVRDPRDVAISLAHHIGISVDRAIAQMISPTMRVHGPAQLPFLMGDWGGHVDSWSKGALGRVKIIRYEDLRHDTPGVMADIIDFLGGDFAPDDRGRAVEHSSLKELQRQEEVSGFREAQPQQARFFRSGLVGEWHDTLTRSQCERIEHHFGSVMRRLGYRLSA